jgi:glycosyltransferase involved in cell wall biosynthesis
MSPRILMLVSEYPHATLPLGGIFFKDQALALQRTGTRVDVIYVEPRSLRSVSLRAIRENRFQFVWGEEDGIRTLRLKGWNTHVRSVAGGRIGSFLLRRVADRYLRSEGPPDLIHAQNALWAGHASSVLSRRWGVPYVLTEHFSGIHTHRIPRGAGAFVQAAYEGAAKLFAVSGSLARSMERYAGGRTIEVLPNVVDTDFFALRPQEPPGEPFVFLAVGALNENKGFDRLLRAFAQAFGGRNDPSSLPDAPASPVLRIGGDGPLRDALPSLAAELGIGDRVRFLGHLTREQVRDEMWRAHALVVASHSETFGLVLIEALATGLPVIATRCGGPEDVITPEVGFLVDRDDPADLARALDDVRRSRPGPPSRLREHAVRRYAASAIAARLNQAYREVIDGSLPEEARRTV